MPCQKLFSHFLDKRNWKDNQYVALNKIFVSTEKKKVRNSKQHQKKKMKKIIQTPKFHFDPVATVLDGLRRGHQGCVQHEILIKR